MNPDPAGIAKWEIHSDQGITHDWRAVVRLRGQTRPEDMSSLVDHAGAALLRLIRRQRRSQRQFPLEPVPRQRPLPVEQREVRFSDVESVATLKERGGLGKDSRANWDRLWRDNPAMAVANSPLSMGWV